MKTPNNLNLPRLRELLAIPEFGDLEQDWDLLMADAGRVVEFLDDYESETLNDVEKNVLMQLIVASYDEKLMAGDRDFEAEKRLIELLKRDIKIHKDIFEYWACLNDSESEGWEITPMLRKIWFNKEENKI